MTAQGPSTRNGAAVTNPRLLLLKLPSEQLTAPRPDRATVKVTALLRVRGAEKVATGVQVMLPLRRVRDAPPLNTPVVAVMAPVGRMMTEPAPLTAPVKTEPVVVCRERTAPEVSAMPDELRLILAEPVSSAQLPVAANDDTTDSGTFVVRRIVPPSI